MGITSRARAPATKSRRRRILQHLLLYRVNNVDVDMLQIAHNPQLLVVAPFRSNTTFMDSLPVHARLLLPRTSALARLPRRLRKNPFRHGYLPRKW